MLLTDNPACIACFAVNLGFQDVICSRCELLPNGTVGRMWPIVNKGIALSRYCKRHGLTLGECLHVGDGENDIAVFERVGASLAINGESRKVELAANFSLRTNTILDVLKFCTC